MTGSKKRSRKYRQNCKKRKIEREIQKARVILDNLSKQNELESDNSIENDCNIKSDYSIASDYTIQESDDKHDCEIVENFDCTQQNNKHSDYQFERNIDTDESDVCSNDNIDDCYTEIIQDLIDWVVSSKTPHVHVDKLLKILRKRFLPLLPQCTKTLLKSNVTCDIELMHTCNDSVGEFKYYGIYDKLKEIVNPALHVSNTLELIFNIDGISPFKSSSACMWPILCKVYTEHDVYEPFTVAIYSGKGKPKSCAQYLEKFVKELNCLQKSEIIIRDIPFKVTVKYFSCDTPARSFLKCVMSHVSFKGCERCYVIGKKVDGVTVFLGSDCEKKTDNDLRVFKDPDYHTGVTLLTLIEPAIDIVNQFVLDPMHLLYLGCTKRILEYLLTSNTTCKARLSSTMKNELKRRSKEIQYDIVDEFPRKMRPTDEFNKYKAVELKFFILYAAPFLLKKILDKEVYEHLILFVKSCRLLSEKDPSSHIATARFSLKKFVEHAPNIYGPTFTSLNVHNLIHISDDIESTNCNLNEISAFSFESYLGKITSLIRSPKHLVAQYSRRLLEQENCTNKVASNPQEIKILCGKKQIKKIKYKGMILGNVHPNSTVLLKNGNVADIIEFHQANEEFYIKYKIYEKKISLNLELNSLNIWEVKKLSSRSEISPISQVQKKFIKFGINFSPAEDKKFFIIPLLH